MKEENIILDEVSKEEIEFAERCGLAYTGDNENPYIGDSRAWNNFDEGGEMYG